MGLTQPPTPWHREIFTRGWGCRGVRLTTHLYLLPKLGISTAVPPVPLCTFLTCVGETLHLYCWPQKSVKCTHENGDERFQNTSTPECKCKVFCFLTNECFCCIDGLGSNLLAFNATEKNEFQHSLYPFCIPHACHHGCLNYCIGDVNVYRILAFVSLGTGGTVSGPGARGGPYPKLAARRNSLETSGEGHTSQVLHPP
jgi:hypothetical protein